jgi:capsular exopolysaccharide synthesis family protein
MVETLLRPTVVPNLRLLTTGPLPPNPSELLGSKRMTSVLDGLRSTADLVVIDSPPVTVLSDAVALAKAMDGVLLVFRKGITRQGAAKRAIAALQQVQVHCLGVVINGVPEQDAGYHYSFNRDYAKPYYRRPVTATRATKKIRALAQPVRLEET